MTSEKRTTIQLRDIKAIEMECLKCHAKIVRPIASWYGDVTQCANCNEQWMMPQAQDFKNLRNLVNALATCTIQAADKQPYALRLEIEGLEP
jgi:hypothetical protein